MILKPRLFRKPCKGHWATKGLVCFPLMNEGSGNKVFDVTGNGNTGTIYGTSPTWTGGKSGPALDFPGTDEHIKANGIISNAPPTGSWTIIGRVKWDSTVGNVMFAGYVDESDSERLAIGVDDGFLKISSNGHTPGVGGAISTNQWYQLALTLDAADFARAYINDQFDYGVDASGANYGLMDGFRIADIVMGGTEAQFLNGQIDHVMLWNRVLTAWEIALIYRNPFCMFERDLIELWSAATLGAAGGTILPQITTAYMRVSA